MPTCRKNILYKVSNTNLSCRARTHCNECTFIDADGNRVPDIGNQPNGNQQNGFNGGLTLGITNQRCIISNGVADVQLFNNRNDRFVDDNNNFIINLDCCDNTCNNCNSIDCCCEDPVRPRKCCANPCIDGALPLLTKCGLKQKKQLQHGITLVNPCTDVFPNPCPTSRNPRRPVKCHNKNYSFNDQLLLLKSNAFNKSVYNCNQFVRGVGCRNRNGGTGGVACPTQSCFN